MKKISIDNLPKIRGSYRQNAPLGEISRFGTGGKADILFKPFDTQDLAEFMRNCPQDIPITVVGLMSNIIVREGGVRGVVIRLGKEFNFIKLSKDNKITVGASVLDRSVAEFCAENGIGGMSFLAGIPGSIGGAVRMNAGAYSGDMKNILESFTCVSRKGEIIALTPDDVLMSYRHTDFPPDHIVTECVLQGEPADIQTLKKDIETIKTQRNLSQPVFEKTGGSTFANPEGYKAWQLIDEAGCRGLRIGGAMMSDKHCNFMINTGNATATDLENLGNQIIEKVYEKHGITLRWEVKIIGDF